MSKRRLSIGGCDFPGDASRVSVSSNLALVTGSSGLHVVDISNPAAPRRVGFYPTMIASDIAGAGNYAYLVENGSGLAVIDISNPALPARIGSLDLSFFGSTRCINP